MPEKADEIHRQIGITEDSLSQGMDSVKKWGGVKAGASINHSEQLFPRIDDDRKEELLKKLKGESMEESKTETQENKKEDHGSSADLNMISIDEFAKLDLRVGEIKEAEKVEKSKKLIKLKVDIGVETRQIVAGIATCYSADELIGKKIILVANLKPARLMGIESQGMVLAATSGDKISLAGFQDELTLGSRVK
jgi:methionyl-tRNA synthetase